MTHTGIINVEGIEGAELQKLISRRNSQIIKDAFTRIYNEQFISERLPHDILISREKGISMALFVIKVGNIDVIRNTYGEEAGKRILKEVAKVINSIPRTSHDWVSKYRNDDMVMVMYNMSENKANRTCKKIRQKTNLTKFDFSVKASDIELSIGYHIIRNENLTPDQFIEKALNKTSLPGIPLSESNTMKLYDKFFDIISFFIRRKSVRIFLREQEIKNCLLFK